MFDNIFKMVIVLNANISAIHNAWKIAMEGFKEDSLEFVFRRSILKVTY